MRCMWMQATPPRDSMGGLVNFRCSEVTSGVRKGGIFNRKIWGGGFQDTPMKPSPRVIT